MTATAVRERPILFSGEMVRAILDGNKSQTRRVVKPQPDRGLGLQAMFGTSPDGFAFGTPGLWRQVGPDYPDGESDDRRCPYGQPGDHLWVREAWHTWEECCDDGSGSAHGWDVPCVPHCKQVYVAYAATPRTGWRARPDGVPVAYLADSSPLENYPESLTGPWRPSIHMPRWASRITLEVTDVRVQRLQEISEEDAIAEGATQKDGLWCMDWSRLGTISRFAGGIHARGSGQPLSVRDIGLDSARTAFGNFWTEINAKRGYSWDSNPWVWALTFRRIAQ